MQRGGSDVAGPWRWLRLAIGAACAASASLTVIPAPTSDLWKLGLGATEWGHLLAALALTPLLPGWRRSWAGRLGAVLGLLGAGMAIVPLLRALGMAGQVPAQVGAAFGLARPRAAPDAPARPGGLSLVDLVRGIHSPAVAQSTVTFSGRSGHPLAMDLYHSLAAPSQLQPGPAPCVITIHGGSWQTGTRADLPALNRYLAARGYVVAALEYRMGPDARFPAAADDVHAAIAYLKEHARDLQLDATRLALLGRSAGGQLALLTAYTPPDPAIRGVVSLYGPADLVYGYTHPTNPAVLNTPEVLEAYLGGSPATLPAAYAAASPVNFVGPTTPPTLLIHGDRDALVSVQHSIQLDARLAGAGRPHFLLRMPWADHGCDVNLSGPCGQLATYTIERFLAAVLQ
ncbi:MAG TPA: alpha/beta hydrolase [Chloroflexia bacterium]|nr:alpha/beta hydrolase [Chloroflexia bacterium]